MLVAASAIGIILSISALYGVKCREGRQLQDLLRSLLIRYPRKLDFESCTRWSGSSIPALSHGASLAAVVSGLWPA
jgi:hypothetical protein